MNVLQLVPNLEVGGVETGTIDLARYLTFNAHKACVISGGGKLVKKLDELGARHFKMPIGRKNPFLFIYMILAVRDIILTENIDIVHARSRVPALIGFFAARLTSKIFITTAHGQYKKHLLSYVMGWGKYVIVANQLMAQHMMDNFRVRFDKIRVIPRGVDTRKFLFQLPDDRIHDKFTVGMIARMTPLKGHPDFVKSASILSRSINKLKVYIVGSEKMGKLEYINDINLVIKRLALTDIIEFIDYSDDVPALLTKLDVLVSANREKEAFGRIIIEAQSAGVPCVATKVGGVADLIEHGKTGLLCEPSNPQDMASKIMTLYHDEGLRNELAINGRKFVEQKYSLDNMVKSTFEVYKEAMDSVRILVIKLGAVGDAILSIPSIRALRLRYPKAVIKLLTGSESFEVLKYLPYIDGIINYDYKRKDRGVRGFMRIASELRREDFDIVIDFQNNKKSHQLSFYSFAPLRYGYDNGKFSFLLNKKVKDDGGPIDPIAHQMKVLKLLGISDIDKKLALFPSKEDRIWVVNFLKDNWVNLNKPIITLNLESSAKWVTKRWPVEYFIELTERLAKEFMIRVIVTGQNLRDKRSLKFIDKTVKCKPLITIGKIALGELIALIEKSNLVVTSDSAPMHIAAALNTPFIAIFGPTDPKRHLAPADKFRLMKKDMKCSPCYHNVCRKGYLCMKSIKPDEVFEAICDMLNLKDSAVRVTK